MPDETPILTLSLPFKAVIEANSTDHWTVKRRRHKSQSTHLWLLLQRYKGKIPVPCVIIFTRIAPRAADDDNLVSCFKHLRDSLCMAIFPGSKPGQKDSHPGLTFRYCQKKGNPKEYAVQIEVLVKNESTSSTI